MSDRVDEDNYHEAWLSEVEDKLPAELLRHAAVSLVEQRQYEAAALLLLCRVDVRIREQLIGREQFQITVEAPEQAYEILTQPWHSVTRAISDAFQSYMTEDYHGFTPQRSFPDAATMTRAAALEAIQKRLIHNQGVDIQGGEIISWQGMRFRSRAEERIARALDEMRVLFLPNCLARLNSGRAKRVKREADFLICHDGKWGILEVDGPYHTSAAADHGKDRLFKGHGVKVVERYPADDCYNDALGVVRQFLQLLEKNG
jgi:very-short-patch-repair endonuclease